MNTAYSLNSIENRMHLLMWSVIVSISDLKPLVDIMPILITSNPNVKAP